MVCELSTIQQQLASGACAFGQQTKTREVLPSLAKAGSLAAGVGAVLASLVRVATDVARVDEMVAQLEASAPTPEEALKWHEIAVQSLAWSRAALVQQQSVLLEEFRALVQGPPSGFKPESSSDSASTAAGSDGNSEPETETTSDCAGPSESSDQSSVSSPLSVRRRWTEESAKEVVGSLSADLVRLEAYSAGRCLLVRKIKPLGLDQPRRLTEHFEQWGAVTEVLVAHSYEKASTRRRHGRVRPASMGFVVMSTDDAANAVLEAGQNHIVEGGPAPCEVAVQSYDPHAKNLEGRLISDA